ncbi:MAG: S1 RNA-binding domain-containing protein [Polyangiales bacterium]
MEESFQQADKLREGDIVSGTVVAVGRDNVTVDIGYKSEGAIPISEFSDATGGVSVKVGDRVDVLVESKETDDGLVQLSKERADKAKVWDEISAACDREELIRGTITTRVKGGLSVTISGGVKAFLPGSQVDLRPIRNLDKLLGQTYEFKVIKFSKKRGNIVLSRRALLEQERDCSRRRRSRPSKRARSSPASSRTSPSTAPSSTSAASTASSTSPT